MSFAKKAASFVIYADERMKSL